MAMAKQLVANLASHQNQIELWGKYVKWLLSVVGQQAVQDCDVWEE